MGFKSGLEKILERLLPQQVFRALIRLSRRFKDTRNRCLDGFDGMVLRMRRLGHPCRIRIVNLDMYKWIGIDLLDHIRLVFGKEVLVLENALRWNDYETDAGCDPPVTLQNYADYTYEGLLLWEVTKVSIMKHLGRIVKPGISQLDDEELACVEKYYAWSINCHRLISERLDALKPHVVLLTQGGVYDSRIIAELAMQRGIAAVALENSFSSEHFFADRISGQVLNRHTIALTGSFMNECKAMDMRVAEQEVTDYFQRSLENKSSDHKTGGAQDPATVLADLAVPAGRKILLFLGQVRTDASIILDSTLYPDPVDLIRQLVDIVNRHPDYFLIIRLHPKEDTMDRPSRMGNHLERCYHATLTALRSAGIDNAANIRVISDRNVSTYTLMKASDLGITINSQSGLEMSLLGRPVLTAGRCFYAHHGFTWDLSRPELLEATIRTALDSGFGTDVRRALISFCHNLFFDYLIAKDLGHNVGRLYRLLGLPVGCTARQGMEQKKFRQMQGRQVH